MKKGSFVTYINADGEQIEVDILNDKNLETHLDFIQEIKNQRIKEYGSIEYASDINFKDSILNLKKQLQKQSERNIIFLKEKK
jgi:hypothetical protein